MIEIELKRIADALEIIAKAQSEAVAQVQAEYQPVQFAGDGITDDTAALQRQASVAPSTPSGPPTMAAGGPAPSASASGPVPSAPTSSPVPATTPPGPPMSPGGPSPAPVPGVPMATATSPAPAPAPQAASQAAPVQAVPTLDDIRALANDFHRAHPDRAMEVMQIIGAHKTQKMDELPPASYPDVYNRIKALSGVH